MPQEFSLDSDLIFQSSREMILILDGELRIISANPYFLEYSGLSGDDLSNKKLTDFIQDFPHLSNGEKFFSTSEKHGKNIFQSKFQGKEIIFDSEIRLSPISLSGKPYIMSFIRDITDQKETEEMLIKASFRWREMFDLMPDPICMLSPDGFIIRCNQKLAELAKLPVKETVGQVFIKIFPFLRPEKFNEAIDTLSKKEKREFIYREIEGRFFQISFDPFFEDQDKFAGTIVIMSDITDWLIAKKNLEDTEIKLSEILDSVPNPIFYKDTEGIYEGCNLAFCDFLGRKKEEIIGHTIFETTREKDPSFHDNKDRELLRTGGKIIYESKVTSADLTVHDVIFYKSAIVDSYNKIRGLVGIMVDITGMKEYETALLESENRLKLALEGAKEALWDIDIKEGTTFFSPDFYSMLGYDQSAVPLGLEYLRSLVHPDDQENVGKKFGELLEGQASQIDIEFRLKHKNGDWRWFSIRGKTIYSDKPGKTMHIIGTSADITDRKDLENLVYLENKRLRYQISLGGMADQTEEEIAEFVLKSCLDLTASRIGIICFKDFNGQNIVVICANNWRQIERSMSCLDSGTPQLELLLSDIKQKESFDGLSDEEKNKLGISNELKVPIFNLERTISGNLWVFDKKDPYITAEIIQIEQLVLEMWQLLTHKRDSMQLRENEEKFQILFEQASVGIAKVSLEETILEINNKFCEILGFSREELLQKNVLDMTYPEDLEVTRQRLKALISGTTSLFEMEKRYIRKDKNLVWCYVTSGMVRNSDGSPLYLITVVTDITDKKKAEEAMIHSIHEKEVLLKEIHHRVKNNLYIVTSLLELEKEKIKNEEAITIINESVNRIRSMAIIHEKLYASKDLSKINIEDYLHQLSDVLLENYSTGTGIKLEIKSEKLFMEINFMIPFGLMVNEMITNSIKYAFKDRENAKIIIQIYKKSENTLIFEFQDNGKGIPDSVDFRKPATLGLQIINDLTHQLDGSVELIRNEGTHYIFNFPLAD